MVFSCTALTPRPALPCCPSRRTIRCPVAGPAAGPLARNRRARGRGSQVRRQGRSACAYLPGLAGCAGSGHGRSGKGRGRECRRKTEVQSRATCKGGCRARQKATDRYWPRSRSFPMIHPLSASASSGSPEPTGSSGSEDSAADMAHLAGKYRGSAETSAENNLSPNKIDNQYMSNKNCKIFYGSRRPRSEIVRLRPACRGGPGRGGPGRDGQGPGRTGQDQPQAPAPSNRPGASAQQPTRRQCPGINPTSAPRHQADADP